MSDRGWQGSIDNLLKNCIGAGQEQSLLIVQEPADEKMYDPLLGDLISDRAVQLGIRTSRITPPVVKEPEAVCSSLSVHMQEADHTLFLSRIGDIARFTPLEGKGSKTVCYARHLSMLDSFYANSCHKLMSELLARLETQLRQSERWHITCAQGTDISGDFQMPDDSVGNQFTLSLFPVTTFCPVPCETANGIVALSRWLMPGGATKVGGDYIPFDGVVLASVSNGTLVELEGHPKAVDIVESHYNLVSENLGTNRNRVHSWHAGINPHTSFDGRIESDFIGWNAISFSSPRYLHFHTCGDIAPCEITWSVFNPTVAIDGERFWQDGEFIWLQKPENRALIIEAGQSQLLEPSASIGF